MISFLIDLMNITLIKKLFKKTLHCSIIENVGAALVAAHGL